MKSRLFGCGKFRRLSSEAADRILSAKEQMFLEKHRIVCIDCVRIEDQSVSALNMLRSVTLEAQVAPMFEERVIRRLRVSKTRASLRYWSPAFVGAGIAFIAIFSALQMVESTALQPGFKSAMSAKDLKSRAELPLLVLERPAPSQTRATDGPVEVRQ